MEHQSFWDKCWRDHHGNIIIYQRPNVWLIGWLIASLLSLFVPRGASQQALFWVGEGLLGAWAVLEIFGGVNYFRRLLGGIVLVLVVAGVFGVGR